MNQQIGLLSNKHYKNDYYVLQTFGYAVLDSILIVFFKSTDHGQLH